MKRKNTILIIVISTIILLATIILIVLTQGNKMTKNESIDYAIDKLTNSEEYKQMSDNQKKEECEKLLNRLKDQGKIKYFSYSESSMLYSFEYSDGVLGGIMIKEWDPYMN